MSSQCNQNPSAIQPNPQDSQNTQTANPIRDQKSTIQQTKEIRDLIVLKFDGVGEKHGANVAGIGPGDGNDGGLGEFIENPLLLSLLAPERGRRRHRRLRLHLYILLMIRRHRIEANPQNSRREIEKKNGFFIPFRWFLASL